MAFSDRLDVPEAVAVARLRRVIALSVGVGLVFVSLIWQLAAVQLVRGGYFDRLADANQIRTITVPAPRGVMYDRYGTVVARNRPSFVVEIVPQQLANPHRELAQLSSIVNVPDAALWTRLLHVNGVTYRDFTSLADAVPLGPVIVADDLKPEVVARFAEQSDKLAGMAVELVPVRQYPYGTAGSHVLGYVGQITQEEYAVRKQRGYGSSDVVGEDGLEFGYDAALRGSSGGRRIKVNSAGAAVATYPDFAATPGNGLDLTIDWRLQRAAESAMDAQIRLLARRIGHRIGGAAIVADPNTGAILALVSQPNFDPNDFAAGIPQKKYLAYTADPLHPLFNRAISGSSPTGSTFKIVTTTAALASGVLTPGSTRYCGGAFWLGDFVFNDDRWGGHGTLTVPQAISQSCDVFFYQVGHQLGIEKLDRYAGVYGIGRRTGIDLPGETTGILPSPEWKLRVTKEEWYPGDTVNTAIGQGFLEASPVQMLKVVSAVANGGSLFKPYLVADVRDAHDRIAKRYEPTLQGRVPLTDEQLQVIRTGMLGAIESPYGTAHNVVIPGFHYAGKTGTAENVPTLDNPSGRNHAWFVCYAPYDKPKIALVVFMEQSGGFGAVNAAPVAQAIVAAYFHLKQVTPIGNGIRD